MKTSGLVGFLKIHPIILVVGILLTVGMPKESAAQIRKRVDNTPDEDGVAFYSTKVPDDATEAWIIDMIKQLSDPKSMEVEGNLVDHYQFTGEAPFIRIAYVDQLLERYPTTQYRDEATIAKLEALEEVAPQSYKRTRDLAAMTSLLTHEPHTLRLAIQAAFYNIRAFQLLARHEKISMERWLPGAIRRYEDFIRRYPKSKHAPRIYAFWVRDAIDAGRQLDANDVVNDMIKQFPNNPLSILSLDRVTSNSMIDQPYNVQFTTFDGKTIKSNDLKGKVLVVHYWHPDNRESTGVIGELIRIHAKFHANYGLQLLGVVQSEDEAKVKAGRKRFKTNWPQCKNELDPATGKRIQRFHTSPAFLVIGADGLVSGVAFDATDLFHKVQVALLKKP